MRGWLEQRPSADFSFPLILRMFTIESKYEFYIIFSKILQLIKEKVDVCFFQNLAINRAD